MAHDLNEALVFCSAGCSSRGRYVTRDIPWPSQHRVQGLNARYNQDSYWNTKQKQDEATLGLGARGTGGSGQRQALGVQSDRAEVAEPTQAPGLQSGSQWQVSRPIGAFDLEMLGSGHRNMGRVIFCDYK